MESEADVQLGEQSFETLQAIRELWWYCAIRKDAERCEAMRLEYSGLFQDWALET